MDTIRQRLQEYEDEQENGYQLKTNKELLDTISHFGNGETEFHTVDIERIVVEKDKMLGTLRHLTEVKEKIGPPPPRLCQRVCRCLGRCAGDFLQNTQHRFQINLDLTQSFCIL